MKSIYTEIYKEIRKRDKILIVRHIGPDPDAVSSQIALKKSIELTFPNKKVYAIGTGIAKFKYIGKMDKDVSFDYENDLVIALDVPNAIRIDGLDVTKFNHVLKIDHHPQMEKYYKLGFTDVTSSSTAQLIYELIESTKLKMNTEIASDIFVGIVSDTHRFLFDYTSAKTHEIVASLIKKYKINTTELFSNLYKRPLAEVRLMGYISSNLKVTNNKFAYLIIEDEVLKELGADASACSNMINDYNNINEVLVWLFASYDPKNKDLMRINIRSRGPVINTVAESFGGGGHQYASGIRLNDPSRINEVLEAFDKLCSEYKEEE